jgi:hypothetical protein
MQLPARYRADLPDIGVSGLKVTDRGTLGERKVNGGCPTVNEQQADRLEMRWLPVLDDSGRTRMEASWVTVPAAPSAQEHAVTHAA